MSNSSDVNSVEISNLSFYYPDSNKAIFNNINISVPGGQFVCLLGPSGCGKSTLLRLIAGLEKPTTGEIIRGGIQVIGASLSKGVVFQDYGLFPWMTTGENIELALEQRYPEMSKKEIESRAKEMLGKVGLNEEIYNQLPKELSGGMKQRCAIARAFAIDPPVLLMDEPFGALDAVTRARLQDLMLELWGQGDPKKTVFFVTHDVDEALLLSEKIFVLGQSGNDVIFETDVLDSQRSTRGEKDSDETFKLRYELVYQINRDVTSRINEE